MTKDIMKCPLGCGAPSRLHIRSNSVTQRLFSRSKPAVTSVSRSDRVVSRRQVGPHRQAADCHHSSRGRALLWSARLQCISNDRKVLSSMDVDAHRTGQ